MNFKTKKVNIIFIGDWHLGNAQCDENLLMKHINKISKMNNTYVYLMGDLIENAINNIGVEEQYLSVTYQLKQLKEYIKPIKNKILGCILGNHEWRTTRKAQANLLKELYEGILGIPVYNFEHYFSIALGRDLKDMGFYQNQSYRIIVRHPQGRGTTLGWITNQFKKVSRIISGDYDLMVLAHFHQVFIHERHYLKADSDKLYTKYDCISGHYLDYKNSYAHQLLLSPYKKGCIMATFYRDEHKIEVKEFE